MIKSFDELSIKKYRELIELEKNDDTEYALMILSILSDIDIDELLDMPLDDFTKLMGQTKFIYGDVEKTDYKKIGKKFIEHRNETFNESLQELLDHGYDVNVRNAKKAFKAEANRM